MLLFTGVKGGEIDTVCCVEKILLKKEPLVSYVHRNLVHLSHKIPVNAYILFEELGQ